MTQFLVVTPTLGDSAWLEQTVASVASAVPDCIHVLVAPGARCAQLRVRFPHATVLAEAGNGMYGAINTALAAGLAWHAFTYINDDDLLLPAFSVVAALVGRHAGQPLVAYGGVRLIDGAGRRLGGIPISPRPALNRALYAQRLEPVYQHGAAVTRAVYDRMGGFDDGFRFCGDSEFLARACVNGIPFVRATRREVAAFRLRRGQLTKARAAMVAERQRVDAKLGLCGGPVTLSQRYARFRFRLANLPLYAERIARHGFVPFDELLSRSD